MSACRHIKSPDAVLDYLEDWGGWLAGDTIASSSWAASDPGLEVESGDATDSVTTVWISGGVEGRRYTVTNTIVSAGGRTASRSITVIVHQL